VKRTAVRKSAQAFFVGRLFLITAFFAAGMAFTSFSAHAGDTQARQIMEKVDARDDGDNKVWDMVMILIDANGNKRTRKAHALSKDKGRDTLRLMFFVEPADVRNTAFLTYDYDTPDKDDDQWLYLPALHKTKRIAASQKSNSFMGSDFSYADLTKWRLDDYDYTLIKEVTVGDAETWVIQSVPRTEQVIEEYGYIKSLICVRKDNFVIVRAIHWLKKKNQLKYMDVRKLEVIDGIWVATEIHMATQKSERTIHSTIMKNERVRFNQNVQESWFTVRRMEKGL
jgi:hypothetical protein